MEAIRACKVHYLSTLDKVHDADFVCVGVKGDKWCVKRDIFLETYKEVK